MGRALPRAYLQADLDLVGPAGQAPIVAAVAETECIQAALQILEQLHDAENYEIRLGHCSLLDAVVRLCQIPPVRTPRSIPRLMVLRDVPSWLRKLDLRSTVWERFPFSVPQYLVEKRDAVRCGILFAFWVCPRTCLFVQGENCPPLWDRITFTIRLTNCRFRRVICSSPCGCFASPISPAKFEVS